MMNNDQRPLVKLSDDSIQEFLGQLDDHDIEGFIEVAKGILFELTERAAYQADVHDMDVDELLEKIGFR